MVDPPNFTRELQNALRTALSEAESMRHEYVTLEHLLLAFLREDSAVKALKACGADVTRLEMNLREFLQGSLERVPEDRELEVQQTVGVARAIHRAAVHAISSDKKSVDVSSVLVAMFREDESQALYFLHTEGVTRLDILNYVSHGTVKGDQGGGDDADDEDGEAEGEEASSTGPLERFTVNLNVQAAEGRIDPLIGRENELERTIRVLCRRRKNNPLFVGEPGVGKTAIAEGLALHIAEGKVPDAIKSATIFSLDMGALIAGTRFRGQFEERLKGVLRALKNHPDAILFIDEIHTIVGAGATSGGSMDASNLLKPALASGTLRCIGSTTYAEYKSAFERDRALARRFQRIEVGEPTVDDTVKILEGLSPKYAAHHGVTYVPEALRAAAELSARYVNDKLLPDKAIDVMDEAGAQDRMRSEAQRSRTVDVAAVESIVARMARIPEKSVSATDKHRLKTLESDLKAVIFGQDEAIAGLASAIKLARSGLRAIEKPIGSFLFSGPTGVGKTELAKQLAKVLGVEFLRFDMSEYSERHTVSRLIGAPPGYVGFDQGGLLTDAVNKHPHSVVVLDEIEKAHPDLFNILLQVMDHATLTDNNGKKSDFRNVVLIMTTNAGAQEMAAKVVGFGAGEGTPDNARAKAAIERTFTPEFRNRLDGWMVFAGLSMDVILKVVDKELLALQAVLDARRVFLVVSPDARAWLGEKGYDAAFGARPMARLIERTLKKPLSEALLFGALADGGTARADLHEGEIVFSFT